MTYILMVGSITTGFKFYGPFPDFDTAAEFDERHKLTGLAGWIIELEEVSDE